MSKLTCYCKEIHKKADFLSDESDKENCTVTPARPKKRNKQQFHKMNTFLKVRSTFIQYRLRKNMLREKENFDTMFEAFTVELNGLGPPMFSHSEWRQKLNQLKYNNKQKRNSSDPKNATAGNLKITIPYKLKQTSIIYTSILIRRTSSHYSLRSR